MCRCIICDEVKENQECSPAQKERTVDARKCKECAHIGRPITGRSEMTCNNSECGAIVQVRALPQEKQEYYRRHPDAKVHCESCRERGCTPQQPEVATCSHKVPVKICDSMERVHGKARFKQVRQRQEGERKWITAPECFLCQRTHVKCKTCPVLMELPAAWSKDMRKDYITGKSHRQCKQCKRETPQTCQKRKRTQ